ncbi:histidine kinase [Emydomyces testavorans]|uniref:histidine kinase n=1 Tax=Emydomyces testavorans TaxID=2070801 RepID=A0AAF0DFT7_9EURO|nr:histidine kinase [Emydomyces testavorans]
MSEDWQLLRPKEEEDTSDNKQNVGVVEIQSTRLKPDEAQQHQEHLLPPQPPQQQEEKPVQPPDGPLGITEQVSEVTLVEQISGLQISEEVVPESQTGSPEACDAAEETVQPLTPITPDSDTLESKKLEVENNKELFKTPIKPASDTFESKKPEAENNKELFKILSLTPIPTIILNSSLHVVHISDSHHQTFNVVKDEYLGQHICDLEPSKIPAPNAATVGDVIKTAISTQNVQLLNDVEDHHSQTYFRLRVTPIFEANVLLFVVLEALSITNSQLKSKVREHAYAMETFRVLVDTVSDYAIFMLDTKGYVTTWNAGAAILKGYTAEEIIGKHFSVFHGEEDRAKGKPAKELVLALHDGKVEDEGWRFRKDGSRFWANVTITPVHQFGHHVGFVKVTRDLTERKAAEARLIAAYDETSKLKSDFLANMSHEIRTPMNGVLGALSLLNNTDLSQQQREYTAIIEESTSVLLQLINDILDYSKLTSGSFSLTTDVFSVENVVNGVIQNCQPNHTDVEIKNIIDPNFPKHVRGDPLGFRQILQNLIGNAVKFTEKGYIHVRTDFTEDQKNNDYHVTVEVIDSGIGVADESMGTLFAPFTRSADSTAKRYQGTGLGLSICKSLAELMGGSVGYRTNPDCHGSVFWLKIKLGRIDAPSPRSAVCPSSDPCEDLKKIAPRKQLLLVEDNMINQVVLLKMLSSLDFERVDATWDGAEAVRLVKQKPLAYDAILMDVSMPIMDGLQATTAIREMRNDVPVIAVTGNALKGDFETYLAKGMNDFIAKPIHRKELARVLLQWIGH